MDLNLCKELRVKKSSSGYIVETPFKYYDRDSVVVYAWREANSRFRVSDNGEAAERLTMDGIDVESERIDRWIADARVFFGLNWDAAEQSFWAEVTEVELGAAIFRVAEAASQLQAMTSVRVTQAESTFKAEMTALIREVAEETQVEVLFDAPVVSRFIADALFLVPNRPLAIIFAQTKDRLLEAELMWSNARRMSDPTRVYAVIESAEKVGRKETERAQFYTDKTLPYRNFAAEVKHAMLEQVTEKWN